jgi:N-acyl-L-homoserine lactone synthetase
MQFTTETLANLPLSTIVEISRYRHRVFVEKLGWSLKCQDRIEYDEFDRPDTLYVVARSKRGDIVGLGRLLPTTKPYLLSEIFPHLIPESKMPSSSNIWELSRFAAIDFNKYDSHQSLQSNMSSENCVQLMHQCILSARAIGASELISVSPIGVERLLRQGGIKFRRLGPVRLVEGDALFANSISCL